MPITVNDIKLLESERLADTDDGGGRMTGSVVNGGEVNNLFPDISRLDRTYGRLSLRKAYMAVQSLNTDVYLGAHAIVTDPPDDDRMFVTLFTTNSPVDERDDAQNRIESYVTRGPKSPYYLFGAQPQGAKAITLFGRNETQLPEVGEVMVLSVESDNGLTITSEQYVRIAAVDWEMRTFTDDSGDYQRKIVTLILTSELRQTFAGAEASRYSNVQPPTKVRYTTIADASRYFGISELAEPVLEGDLEIYVPSIFSQLVPSTTREVGVAGARPGLTLNYVQIGNHRTDSFGGLTQAFVHRGILPNSIDSWSGSPSGATDDGEGNIVNSSGSDVGDIDYETGRLSGSIAAYIVGWTPATVVQRSAYSYGILIQLANQGTVYVTALPVAPAEKTLTVDYRYLGKWYTLRDLTGLGTLEGSNPAEGGGTINYVTGNVIVTLGALPDIGSQVIFSVGQNVDFTQRVGEIVPTTPKVEFLTAHPIELTSGTLEWTSNAVVKTATFNSGGVISGDGTGTVIHADGFVSFVPASNAWPDSNSTLVMEYTKALYFRGTIEGTFASNIVEWTFPAEMLPIKPYSMIAKIPAKWGNRQLEIWVKDDGTGGILVTMARFENNTDGNLITAGSINYTTGEVSVEYASIAGWMAVQDGFLANGRCPKFTWELEEAYPVSNPTPLIQYWVTKVGTGSELVEEEISFPGIYFYMGMGFSDSIVPGSLWFSWGGKQYFDRQGKIFRDLNTTNGSATEAGSINYATGEVKLTNWGTTSGGTATLITLLTSVGLLPAAEFTFRTPGSPLRPASFYIQAVRTDTGALVSAVSTINGPIANAVAEGFCDHQMGWVNIRWGSYVTAAGNENEPWYDEANVVGANVFKPIPVDPSTVTFNCVVLSTLPLDADLLGIDPVRLPSSGQVPIFREGNVIVIHEERTFEFPGSVVAGETVNLPDSPITQVYLKGDNNAIVPIDEYIVHNQDGEIEMADPMDLTGITQPLTAVYVVDDMILVSGVELSGRIQLVSPVSRDYDAGVLVSSALLFGDLQAQNPVFFSQQTWTGVYDDARIGSNTTAQYNRTLYPLELINKHAVTERWALIFTNSTSGNVVGETLGVIGTFSIAADTQPTNPVTGLPYFILRSPGWGTGWATNNVLRFNTIGPNAPIWIARTIIPGAQALTDDRFSIQMRGDAD